MQELPGMFGGKEVVAVSSGWPPRQTTWWLLFSSGNFCPFLSAILRGNHQSLLGKQMPCRIFKWRVFNTSNWFQRCWKLKEQKEGLNIIITRGSSYNSQGRGKQRGDLCSPGPWSWEEEPHITGFLKSGRVMWLAIRFQTMRIQPAFLPQEVLSWADDRTH